MSKNQQGVKRGKSGKEASASEIKTAQSKDYKDQTKR